jgi:hypothetical protein
MTPDGWVALLLIGAVAWMVGFVVVVGLLDRARIRREVEAPGGRVLRITTVAGLFSMGKDARSYAVDYEGADGTPHRHTAVTSFWTGVAWKHPPPGLEN